jgi:threonine/homoserine/homoserine lactone efflux protein
VSELIVEVLPLAVAIVLSPFPVIPAIMLLLTPRAVANGSAFLAGWIVGVAAALGAAVAVSTWVELAYGQPTWASWARIVLGAMLIVLGIAKWLKRGASNEAPAWMASLNTATPATSMKLGLLLSAANPKILVLAAAAGVTIGSAEPSLTVALAVGAMFVLIASVSVALPLLAYLVAGERVVPPLRRSRDWLEAHNDSVMSVVLVVIGLLVFLNGLDGV